jgi:hypothetical protein
MEVLKTTSPDVALTAPIELPTKTVPSASAKMAGGIFPEETKALGSPVLFGYASALTRAQVSFGGCFCEGLA